MEVELDLWSSRSSDPTVDHILSDVDYCDVPDVDEFILGCSSSGLSVNHLSSSSPPVPSAASASASSSSSSTKNDLSPLGGTHHHNSQHHQHQLQYQLPDPNQVLLLFDEPGSEPSLTPTSQHHQHHHQHHHHHHLQHPETSPAPPNDCCDDLNSQYASLGSLVDQPSSSSAHATSQYTSTNQQLINQDNSSQFPVQVSPAGRVTCSTQGPSSSTHRQLLNETLRVDHCYILSNNNDTNCQPTSISSQHQLKQRPQAQVQVAKQQFKRLQSHQQQQQQQVVSSTSIGGPVPQTNDNAQKIGVSSTTASNSSTVSGCIVDTSGSQSASNNLSGQQQAGMLDMNHLQLLLSTQPQVIPYEAPQHMQFGTVAPKQASTATKRRQTGGSGNAGASKRAKAADSISTNSSTSSASSSSPQSGACKASKAVKPSAPQKSRSRANSKSTAKQATPAPITKLAQAPADAGESGSVAGNISPGLSSNSSASGVNSSALYPSPNSSTNSSGLGQELAGAGSASGKPQVDSPQPPARNTETHGKRFSAASRITQAQPSSNGAASSTPPSSSTTSTSTTTTASRPTSKVKGPIKEQVKSPQEERASLSPGRPANKGEMVTSDASIKQQVEGQKESQQTFSLSKLLNQKPANGFATPSSSAKQSPCLIINAPGQTYGPFQVQTQQQQQQHPQVKLTGRIPSPVSSQQQQQQQPATTNGSPSSSPCRSVSLPTSSSSSSNQSSVTSSSLPATTSSTSTDVTAHKRSPSTTCSPSSSLSSSASSSSSSSSSSSLSSSSSSSSSMSSTSSSASSSPTMQLNGGNSSSSGFPSLLMGSGGAALISNQDWKSAQTGQVVMLTEEERRTLLAEGYPIPQRFPLSKAEERSLKKIRRKIKNKISAQESRRKKKEYMEELEKKVHQMESRLSHLEHENRILRERAASQKTVADSSIPLDQQHQQQQQTSLATSFQQQTSAECSNEPVSIDNDKTVCTSEELNTSEHKHHSSEDANTNGELSQVSGGDAIPMSTSNVASLTMNQRNEQQRQTLESVESTNDSGQIADRCSLQRKISTASAFSTGHQLPTDDDYFIDDILMSQETQEGAQQLVNDELVANLVGGDESSSDMSVSDKSAVNENRINFAADEQCSPQADIKAEDLAEPGPVGLLV